MRMMLRFTLPTASGSAAVTSGKLAEVFPVLMGELKPEAAYFGVQDGMRAGFLVIDVQEPAEIPGKIEPLFLALNANIELFPVMTADDLGKAMAGLGEVAKKFA